MGASPKPPTQQSIEAKLRPRLGELVQEEREARGWTQEALAERAGVHWTTVGKIERGVQLPSLGLLVLIARALGISIAGLCSRALDEAEPADEVTALVSSLPSIERSRLVPVLRALLEWKGVRHRA